MHNHGTAVLTRAAEAAPASSTGASSRDMWIAQCESQLAKALATRNANLLPVLADLVFFSDSQRCSDCRGTGYDYETFDLCYCMADERPAYDFPRIPRHRAHSIAWSPLPWQRRIWWTPCPACTIGPVKTGPYTPETGELTRMPWLPDCQACNDTGWTLFRPAPAGPASHNTPTRERGAR